MKKKNIFQHVWSWMLDIGPLKTLLLLELIGLVIGIIAMAAVHWFTRHFR